MDRLNAFQSRCGEPARFKWSSSLIGQPRARRCTCEPRLGVISLLRIALRLIQPFIIRLEHKLGWGRGVGGLEAGIGDRERIFALSANLSRGRVISPLGQPSLFSYTLSYRVYLFSFFFHRHPSPLSTSILAKQKATGHASVSRVSDARFILLRLRPRPLDDVPCIFCRAAARNQKVGVSFSLLPLSSFSALRRYCVRYGRINDRAVRGSACIILDGV